MVVKLLLYGCSGVLFFWVVARALLAGGWVARVARVLLGYC